MNSNLNKYKNKERNTKANSKGDATQTRRGVTTVKKKKIRCKSSLIPRVKRQQDYARYLDRETSFLNPVIQVCISSGGGSIVIVGVVIMVVSVMGIVGGAGGRVVAIVGVGVAEVDIVEVVVV